MYRDSSLCVFSSQTANIHVLQKEKCKDESRSQTRNPTISLRKPSTPHRHFQRVCNFYFLKGFLAIRQGSRKTCLWETKMIKFRKFACGTIYTHFLVSIIFRKKLSSQTIVRTRSNIFNRNLFRIGKFRQNSS